MIWYHVQYAILPQLSQVLSNSRAIGNGHSVPRVRFSLEGNETEQTETIELELDGMEQGPDNVFSSIKEDPPGTS